MTEHNGSTWRQDHRRVALGIDLRELETFITVVELGSFSRAAEHLHVTQPSVTGRVQRLEAALGVRLLVRSTRKLEVTPAGAALLAEANHTLHGLRELVARFSDQAGQARQRVVVASTPMLSSLVLPQLIRDYTHRFTDVRVILRDMRHDESLAAVEDGSADFAVLAFDGESPHFTVQPILTDTMVFVAPPTHALAKETSVTLEEIHSYSLLLLGQYEPIYKRIDDELSRTHQALAPSTAVEHLSTLLGLLDAEMGATLLPRSMAERCRAAGHIILEIDGFQLTRTFSLVRQRKASLLSAADSFSRFLASNMATVMQTPGQNHSMFR